MARSLLAWFLLVTYLPVLGAGLRIGRAEAPVLSAAHKYVHSATCQQEHYLLVDCFEQCNGDQTRLEVKVPTGAGLHFLAQIKGLDVHCADGQTVEVLPRPAFDWTEQSQLPEITGVASVGFGSPNYQPPKRG